MTGITILESGVSFGPFLVEDCFYLEQCPLYGRIRQDTPMAEFALLRHYEDRPTEVWIVEAKSSAPHSGREPERFKEYFDEIRQKMTHALHVLFAAWLARHPVAETGLSEKFMSLQLLAPPIRCVLVIPKAPKEALPPLQSALQRTLNATARALGLPPSAALVINDVLARDRYHLIT